MDIEKFLEAEKLFKGYKGRDFTLVDYFDGYGCWVEVRTETKMIRGEQVEIYPDDVESIEDNLASITNHIVEKYHQRINDRPEISIIKVYSIITLLLESGALILNSESCHPLSAINVRRSPEFLDYIMEQKKQKREEQEQYETIIHILD